jgi:type II secretory ATPase GspE/PulE/Tfp pilus assembly ATPase PilB-like protein
MPNSSPTDVAKDDKEKIAIDALHAVLNEVMTALKKIGEDVDNIGKRVDALEKSISVKVVQDKVTIDGEDGKKEKPKLGDYKVDTVEFAKTSANTKTPVGGNGNGVTPTANPEVQIIKSILTANKELSASDIYYLVRKSLKSMVM